MSYGYRPRTSQRPVSRPNARRFLKRVESELGELVNGAPGHDDLQVKAQKQFTKQMLDDLFERFWKEPR